MLVCAYLVVRAVHLGVYALAASGDRGLRHQLAISWAPMLGGGGLLLVGVLLGGWLRTLLFGLALLVGGIYVTSLQGSWRLHSPAHWIERHSLFVILTMGESVVAIGVGAAQLPISMTLRTGSSRCTLPPG